MNSPRCATVNANSSGSSAAGVVIGSAAMLLLAVRAAALSATRKPALVAGLSIRDSRELA